jgi:hypothetical protein
MAAKKAKKGMGFKAVAKKPGVSQQDANAIIADGARNASPAAKKANPNLKKVLPSKRQRGAVASKRQRGGY